MRSCSNGIIRNSAVGNDQLLHCIVLSWIEWLRNGWVNIITFRAVVVVDDGRVHIVASWWSKCTWVVAAGCPGDAMVVVWEMNWNYRWVSDFKLFTINESGAAVAVTGRLPGVVWCDSWNAIFNYIRNGKLQFMGPIARQSFIRTRTAIRLCHETVIGGYPGS